jgi:hypothetical protein
LFMLTLAKFVKDSDFDIIKVFMNFVNYFLLG